MANWCLNYIKIKSDDAEGLQALYDVIAESIKSNYMKNDFGLNWLGNVVGNTNIGTIDTGKDTDIACRGWLVSFEISGDELLIQTETAWRPLVAMWLKLVEKYLPGAEIIYSGEETGCCIYFTNDPEYVDHWLIDPISTEYEYDHAATDIEVANVMKSVLEKRGDSDLLETVNAYLDGTACIDITDVVEQFDCICDSEPFIRKWEYFDLTELD